MLLCLDVGNTHIVGGVFRDNKIIMRFRHHSVHTMSADQFGLFLKSILKEHQIDPAHIQHVALASVVKELNYTIRAACVKYMHCEPFCITPTIETGIRYRYHYPQELGADRVVAAIAANQLYPNQAKIVANLGTATCICAISKDNEHLGGLIFPGIKISHQALMVGTSNLTSVEIVRPEQLVGLTTKQGIQSGLFYAQLGAIKEIFTQIKERYFSNEQVLTIGTGGMSYLFSEERVLDVIQPDLVLTGLQAAWQMNQ